MKTMTDKMKPEAFKSKEDIDSLIREMDVDNAEDRANTQSLSPIESSPTGSLVEQEFYTGKLFPMIEHYLPAEMQLNKEEKVQLTKGIQRKLTGLSSNMPINCYGDSCPFKSSCPLYAMGKAPVGQNCPMEAMVLDLYTKRYLDEFAVESENFSEVTTMTMLAATHIMEMRGMISIGRDENGAPDGIIRNVVGFTPDEEPITQYQEHPGYAIIERAWRWRTKLLESLGATRKEKLKLPEGMGDEIGSISRTNASLKAALDKMGAIDVTALQKKRD